MPKTLPYSQDVIDRNPDLIPLLKRSARAQADRKRPRLDGFDSDLERAYAQELTARGLRWHYHGLTINLGSGLTYTPDFDYLDPRGFTVIIEVKGSRKMKNARDSLTRWKVAAAMYPQHHWLWVERPEDGRWDERPARLDPPISTEIPAPLGLTLAQIAVARRVGQSLLTLHESVFGAAAAHRTDDDLIRAVQWLVADAPPDTLALIQDAETDFSEWEIGD